MSMDPLAPSAPAEPTKRQLAEENAALKSRVAEIEAALAESKVALDAALADLDAARAAAAEAAMRPVGEESPVLLVALRHDKKHYPAGALVPFDVAKPPKGSEGLVEGAHHERARVLRVGA